VCRPARAGVKAKPLRGTPTGRALTPPSTRRGRATREPPTNQDQNVDHVKDLPELHPQTGAGT